MAHPVHQRKTVGTDPSAKRLGTYQSKPAKKKSLGIMGTAGMISAKALKGLKWPGSPQASKLAMDVAGPGGIKKKLAKTVAKKVVPKVWLRGPGGKPKYSMARDKLGKLLEKSGEKKPGGVHRLKDLPRGLGK